MLALRVLPARLLLTVWGELAVQFGADAIVDHTEGDPVDEILTLTDG